MEGAAARSATRRTSCAGAHTARTRPQVFLPDTAEYGDKLKTWRRFKVRPLRPPAPQPFPCPPPNTTRRRRPRRAPHPTPTPHPHPHPPQRNLENIGGDIYYADDWTPITAFRYTLNFLNMVFYGAFCVARGRFSPRSVAPGRSEGLRADPHAAAAAATAGPNFPCKDTRQGGTQCQYFGHTGGANEGGHLTTASPPNFRDWLRVHMRTSQFQIVRPHALLPPPRPCIPQTPSPPG